MGLKKIGGAFFTRKSAVANVAGCWVVSIIINGPQFFWADVIESRRAKRDCRMPHVDERTLNVYMGAKSVVMFFIPLTITWISYCSIIYRAHKSLKMVRSIVSIGCFIVCSRKASRASEFVKLDFVIRL